MLSSSHYSSGPTTFLDGKHESQIFGSMEMYHLGNNNISLFCFIYSPVCSFISRNIISFLIKTDYASQMHFNLF